MIKKIKVVSIVMCLMIYGCGTLGGFDKREFLVSRKKTEAAIDALYILHPEYKIPEQWQQYNDWSARGYDFLEGRIFYFQSPPEEMYYVTFIGDSIKSVNDTTTIIGIRAINRGHGKWLLKDDVDSKERERIIKRFDDEIISKLEQYTHSKIVKL